MQATLKPSSAARKKAIVALARQLAVDLWRMATNRVTAEELGGGKVVVFRRVLGVIQHALQMRLGVTLFLGLRDAGIAENASTLVAETRGFGRFAR